MVDDVLGDPVGAILRRLTFLHDRLAFVAPEVESVAYVAQRGGRTDAVATTRHDMATTSYSLAVDIGDTQPEPSALATFVVDVPSAGDWTSCVIFEAVDETSLTVDVRHELEITTLIAMSGRHGAGGDAWPAGLARSHAALRTMRDLEGGAHLARLAVYSRLVAAALVDPLGLDEEFVEAVGLYAPLHDVGEMDLPEHILLKPSRLDSSEWDIMKSHTVRGRAMVDEAISGDPFHSRWVRPDALRSIVELHHEALDGHGYPHGLRGDDVPLEARVVTIADVFDALTNSRPYKAGWPVAQALEEMDRMVAAGTIDGWCLTALATQLDALEQVVAQGHEVEEDRMNSTRHEGRVIIVTGAASGIGQATVVRLVREGARVVGCDLNAEGLESTKILLGDLAPGVTLLEGDVTDQAFVDHVVASAGERVDMLANVAGIMDHFVPLGELEDALWDRVMGVNLTAVMRMTRAVLPGMQAAGAGSIVTVASKASMGGGAAGVSYTASKHAVLGLVRHVAYFYGPAGIRSNAVLPGPVATGIGATAAPTVPWAMERAGLSMATMGGLATPDQLASAVSWIGSDEAANINGAILASDGGWSAA